MDNEKVVRNWHEKIIRECKRRLSRELTSEEEHFIRARGSFVALEIIEDTVGGLEGEELESYLNELWSKVVYGVAE